MTIKGVDASGRLDGAFLAGTRFQFACRYLSHSAWKNITGAEYADLQAHGIAVVLVWETTATRMLAGHAAGATDARQAEQMALDVGHPADGILYFAADWDATPAQQHAIDAYLDGAASVVGRHRTGIYGGYWPVSRALDAGKTRYAWQTLAWSGGHIDARAHLVQQIGTVNVGGTECDIDIAHTDDYGQHPCPTRAQEENVTPEDKRDIAVEVWRHQINTPGWPDPDRHVSAETILAWTDNRYKETLARITGLKTALAEVAKARTVDDKTADAIVAKVVAAIDNVSITLDAEDGAA